MKHPPFFSSTQLDVEIGPDLNGNFPYVRSTETSLRHNKVPAPFLGDTKRGVVKRIIGVEVFFLNVVKF